MSERRSVLPFPAWLIAIDGLFALLVLAGLVLRTQPALMASLGLPAGSDLLLLGVGALGVVGCGLQFARIVLTAARSNSSR